MYKFVYRCIYHNDPSNYEVSITVSQLDLSFYKARTQAARYAAQINFEHEGNEPDDFTTELILTSFEQLP